MPSLSSDDKKLGSFVQGLLTPESPIRYPVQSESPNVSDAASSLDSELEVKEKDAATIDDAELEAFPTNNPTSSRPPEGLPVGVTAPVIEHKTSHPVENWVIMNGVNSPTLNNHIQSSTQHPPTQKRINKTTWLLAFFTLVLLVSTIFYVIGLTMTSGSLRSNLIPDNESGPIAVLTILTEFTGILGRSLRLYL